MHALTNPEIPPLLLNGLCFLAGFITAIWLAVALEDANKKMAEEIEEARKEAKPEHKS